MRIWLAKATLMASLFYGLSLGWIPLKAQLAQWLLARAWQDTLIQYADEQPAEFDLFSMHRHKPWPWADTWPVAKLVIPALDESWIILASGSGQSLAFAPGLHTPNVLPGAPGQSIIAGHRDTHFRHLDRLKQNDKLMVELANGEQHVFRIDQIKVIQADDQLLAGTQAEKRLTLITCMPRHLIDQKPEQRLLVSASLSD